MQSWLGGSGLGSTGGFFGGEWSKIGFIVTGCGVFFMFLGILLFFDRVLLSMGNILFLGGTAMIIGVRYTLSFFTQRIKGTVLFFFGVFLVLTGWSFIGIFVEGFGILNLFGDFIPHLITAARYTPVVNRIFTVPGVNWVADKLSGYKAAEAPESKSTV